MQLNINVRQVILMARESILKPSLLCNPEERENEMMELKKTLSAILEIRPLLREIAKMCDYDEAKEDGLVSTYEDIEFGEEYDRFKIDGEWCTTLSACPNKYEINRLKSQIAVYLQQVTRTLSKYYGKQRHPLFSDILTPKGLDREDRILEVIKPIIQNSKGKEVRDVLNILMINGYVLNHIPFKPETTMKAFNSIGAKIKSRQNMGELNYQERYILANFEERQKYEDRINKLRKVYPSVWEI